MANVGKSKWKSKPKKKPGPKPKVVPRKKNEASKKKMAIFKANRAKVLFQSQLEFEEKFDRTPLIELSDKHRRFAKCYILRERNARKAAEQVGFNVWYAQAILIHEPLIKLEIEKYALEFEIKYEVTPERIIAELAKVAFGNLDDFGRIVNGVPVLDFTNTTRSQFAAVSSIEQDIYHDRVGSNPEDVETIKSTKIKLLPKTDALNQLAKILGMHKEALDQLSAEDRSKKIRDALKEIILRDGL